MRALYYPAWQQIEVTDLPKPIPAEGEALVRVANCGICGSELEAFRTLNARRTPPLVMGHEFCGEVESIGESVAPELIGKRVIAHAVVHCGACPACEKGDTNLCPSRQIFGMQRPGAFAEFVAVPPRILIPWPEELPGRNAIFAEPLANGINAMRQGCSGEKKRVVVIGAGPIGLMSVLAASRLHGADIIVADLIPERLQAARALGARHTVDTSKADLLQEVYKHWHGCKADHVIDAVGTTKTKSLSLEVVERGRTVVWVGLRDNQVQIDSYQLTLNQISVAGSYSGSMVDLRAAAKLLASDSVDLSWVTIYPLVHGDAGFQEMLTGEGKNIKGILQMQ
jgi:threonine dehydrogenase-like Zn-dependent dehydrogenase